MECSKCGTENPEGRKFCRECGSRLAKLCPSCGSENLPQDKFCGECGRDLRAERAGTVDYARPRSYTPKFLADKILTGRGSIEGERKLVTVLFADVAGYTSISEKLDPEEVHHIMDDFFGILMDVIHGYEGTINQFTGDGVMALFGAPLAHEDHAQRASHAALNIQQALDGYGERIQRECGVEFRVRVGLNSGPVIVGSIGDDLRMDYTAIGDTTNLAARMQDLAKPGTILVSKDTYRFVKDYFIFTAVGPVRVKGKTKRVESFVLVEPGEVETRLEAAAQNGLSIFVGRRPEMTVLQEAFRTVKSGAGRVVGIVGEAGVGKSRLKVELKNELNRENYTYLEGRCPHYGRTMAYSPVLEVLKAYFDIKEGERGFVTKKKIREKIDQLGGRLKHHLPAIHEIMALPVEEEGFLKLQSMEKRERIFEALRDLLVKESQERPLVLVIEDLQWIDRSSEEFLTYLIGWLPGSAILLIMLFRPEYSHSWGSKSYYRQISLNQLQAEETAELVNALLGARAAPALQQMILQTAGGNPLFVEELVRSLVENRDVQRSNQQYLLRKKPSAIHVPETIHGIIAARLDRLDEHLKRALQVASVIGSDFAFSVLEAVLVEDGFLKNDLQKLQELEFIYEKRLFPELVYTFKHALTREVAYRSLLIKKKREIHVKIGTAMESLYPDRLEEFYERLGYHYSKGEHTEKAYKYLVLAGKKEARNHSLWEAFHFYQEAIRIPGKEPASDDNLKRQIEVRLLMTPLMISLGYPENSLQILQEGEKFALEVGDRTSLATFYSRIGHYYTVKAGNPWPGIVHAENYFAEAAKIHDVELMVHIACDLFASYHAAGEFTRIVEEAPWVLELLERDHMEAEWFGREYNVYSVLAANYGNSLGFLGDFRKGRRFCEKAQSVAVDKSSLYGLGLTELLFGNLLNLQGDGRSAAGHLRKSLECFREGKAVVLMGMARSGSGWAHYFLGDLRTAIREVEKGLAGQRKAGMPP